jgi:tetratricopeptide (TPR) repeat protein
MMDSTKVRCLGLLALAGALTFFPSYRRAVVADEPVVRAGAPAAVPAESAVPIQQARPAEVNEPEEANAAASPAASGAETARPAIPNELQPLRGRTSAEDGDDSAAGAVSNPKAMQGGLVPGGPVPGGPVPGEVAPAELTPTPAEPARAGVLSDAAETETLPTESGPGDSAEVEVSDGPAPDSVVEVVPRGAEGEAGDEEHLEPIPDPMQAEPPVIEAASFNGVTPGETDLAQVQQTWGSPQEVAKQGDMLVHRYRVEPFDRVEVTFFQGKAISLVIRLDESFPADMVAKQLELTNIRPVLVANALGEILGQSFPERGVLFAFEPSKEPGKASMNVTQIILEPISAEPFVLRAETNLDTYYRHSLSDLDTALEFDPHNDRTHWLRARVLSSMGNQQSAIESAAKAVELAPQNPRYRITYARVLQYTGRYEEAIQHAEEALKLSQQWEHVKARALCLMGDLLGSGPQRDYKKAIQYHIEAVQTADPLSTDKHPAIRVAAKETLIDAHLGAANDIAWGHWKQKEKAVNKWLEGASAVADDLIANERGNESLRFRVATRALAAHVGAQGDLDPSRWAEKSLALGRELVESAHDEAKKQQYCWDLGMALYDALQIYQMRQKHDLALRYGELAIDYLEQVGPEELQTPTSRYLLGRLYFRLGAIHAIADKNHRAAIAWFDKAAPLLDSQLPGGASSDLGRHGETFVSMGVSYWETGQREKAVELTERGVELMEKAVNQGSLQKNALSVPYSNLAIMHQQLGQQDAANRFSEMAARHRDATRR